jgi:hypothetical protein
MRAAGALVAASAPLWPSAAHAGDSLSATHHYTVPGTTTTCTIELEAFTYEGGAVFKATVPLTSPDCGVSEMYIYGYALDSGGEEVTGLTGCSCNYAFLQLRQGVEITGAGFEIAFGACERQCFATYSLQPK